MLVFLPYYSNWVELLSNVMCSFHLWNSYNVSADQHHLFSFRLMLTRPSITMLLMILLCISLFSLSHDASQPVVSMEMVKSSTIRLVTSVKFSKYPYSSTLTRLHGCCSFFNFVSMKQLVCTGDCLDEVWNTHIIISFCTYNSKSVGESKNVCSIVEGKVHANNFTWLKVSLSNVVTLGNVVIFVV